MRLEEDVESDDLASERPRRRCCRLSCTCLAGSLPVIFIWAIIAWSYYAYVIAMCGFVVTNVVEKVVYIVLYHPVLFVFVWTYVQTIFTKPVQPPPKFSLSHGELDEVLKRETETTQQEYLESLITTKQLPVYTRSINGAVRYCNRCCLIKPDRAHHCSTCNTCMLKMDHHCPWVGNCVGYHNYKFFNLFLAYGALYCLYVAATSAQYFVRFWTVDVAQSLFLNTGRSNSTQPLLVWNPNRTGTNGTRPEGGGVNTAHRLQILFLFFIAIMFALSLLGLLGYHMWLTAKNRSTLESFRAPIFRSSGPDKDGFNLGMKKNFREVYGDHYCTWLLPIFSSRGDGIRWPTRTLHRPNYHTMENGECEAVEVEPMASKSG